MRKYLACDIESYDPKLLKFGPGVYRKDSYILGVSFADASGWNEYYDLNHPGITASVKNKNRRKVEDLLKEPCSKVFANAIYDLDHLVNGEGFVVNGEIHDIIHAESLLDEYRSSYSLDALALGYLGRGKKKTAIEAWCEERNLEGDARKHLWKMPYSVVAPYAKMDTALLLPILTLQMNKLSEESLMPLYAMERSIFPMLLAMRKAGVRIDEERRAQVSEIHTEDLRSRQLKWDARYKGVNYNSTKQLASLFEKEGIPFDVSNGGKKELLTRLNLEVNPKRLPMVDVDELFAKLKMTETEQKVFRSTYPSITHDLLEELSEDFPVAREVEELKRVDKVLHTFIDGILVEHVTDGRLHPSFHIFSSDEGGTVTGRTSCSTPNAQQVSTKKGNFDPLVRSCFIPEEDCDWGKCDFSQIEYRIIAHFAQGPRADVIQEQYRTDPNTDYHKLVQEWTGVDRATAKRLNFGIAYCMGPRSMAKKFHWSRARAEELIDQYNATVPFLFPTREMVINTAKERGYIHTILGRRCRMSAKIKKDKAYYVAFNRLIQGTAADIMKKSMADTWKAGIFDVLTPHLTVHDELDVSIPRTKIGRQAYEEMKHLMETTVVLRVPILAEAEIGPNWGTLHAFKED
jgi:DNA polymerase-1